jgi:hypothetical protein
MEKRIAPFEGANRDKVALVFAERLVEGCRWNEVDRPEYATSMAKIAYLLADAMIAEGAK